MEDKVRIDIIRGECDVMSIKTGDGFACSRNTLLPDLIHPFQEFNEILLGLTIEEARKCISSEFNHGGIYLWENGILYVVEALFGGIKKTEFAKYLNNPDYTIVVIKWSVPVYSKKAENWLHRYYTKKTSYAVFNLIAYAVYYLTWKTIWIGTSNKNFTSFCCWHFVCHFINECVEYTYTHPERCSAPDVLLDEENNVYYIKREQLPEENLEPESNIMYNSIKAKENE
jgi:hypothetical protein